ncbi:glutamate 5-kinase [Acidithiobacillus sp.]|uniref:glutamate 5-kinase n=1 Tax=Acidithiobacillus sp. TaxID=1872118 RepID=UPI0025C0CC57|nr:glutamate 5-kinase [Acidithiobacillus sp.]
MSIYANEMTRSSPPNRRAAQYGRRWVVKVGSSLLTREDGQPDRLAIRSLVFQMATLRQQGLDVVLVSSGSVSVGRGHLACGDVNGSAADVARRAAASLGQATLLRVFQECFEASDTLCGQLLLTNVDLSGRSAQRRLRDSIDALLVAGAIPILNENDATVHANNGIGNNDLLAAQVARIWRADLLLLLTDQVGLYTADPRRDPMARLVDSCRCDDPRLIAMAGGSKGALGTGGMATKIRAAGLVGRRGIPTLIAAGRQARVLLRVRQGEGLGTWLAPATMRSLAQRLGLPTLPQPVYTWA